jgi:hypothetical protein
MPPSSRYKKYLKMEAPGSFEALATSYQSLWRQISESSKFDFITLFIVVPCILITWRFFLPTNAPPHQTHKMSKRIAKISLCLLLHVSVQLDHPQGAYAELCYNDVFFTD